MGTFATLQAGQAAGPDSSTRRLDKVSRHRLAGCVLALGLLLPGAAMAQNYWGQGTAAATSGDCDPAIQQRQTAMARGVVDSYAALAAGSYLPAPSNFAASSCISRLMSTGVNSIFNPPSLTSIISAIENGLCQYAISEIQQASSSLSQNVTESLPLGELVPGVNLGSLGGGFAISPAIGTNTSGNLINVQGSAPVIGNLNGYWGTPTSTANAYGSLFGASNTAASSGGWFSGFFGN